MLAFDDSTKDLNERSSERMNFRTKPRIKQIIQRAAALSGVDDSVFTMNAAYKSALETIAAASALAPLPGQFRLILSFLRPDLPHFWRFDHAGDQNIVGPSSDSVPNRPDWHLVSNAVDRFRTWLSA